MRKKSVICSLVLLLFVCLYSFIERRTDGFRMDRIYFDLSIPVVNLEQDSSIIHEILDQPFTYLDRGTQFFVFESKDKKHVIKFLSPLHLKSQFWVNFLCFPPFKQYKEAIYKKKEKKCLQTVKACFLAYDRLKENLGLEFIHFGSNSQFHKHILIYDKLGHRHLVDLSKTHFIIQKKAEAFIGSALLSAYKNKDDHKVHAIIDSFLENISYRCKKNVRNTDPNVFKNFAIIGNRVVEVDFGDFFAENKVIDPPLFIHEIDRYARSFRKWANKNIPETLTYFEQKLNQEMDFYEKEYSKQVL